MTEELQGFTWIDTTVLVVYMIAVLLGGIYFSKKEMQGKEFFKSDGTVPWWVTCVSIFATLLSPISFLALPGNSYGGTWMLWFAQIGMIIAIPLTIRYFLPVYAKLDIDTAYHYLELRFNSRGLRVLGALMFVLFQLGRMSIVMYLPCLALANLTGISVDVLIIAMGAIAIVYSYTGGLKAVLWTDFIQGVILIGGITLTLFYIIYMLDGGMSDVASSLTEGGRFLADTEKWMDWTNLLGTSVMVTLVGGGLTTFCSYISSQDVVQRFTTTTDIKQLNKMTIGNGILSIFCASVFYLVGTALYLYYQQNPDLITDIEVDVAVDDCVEARVVLGGHLPVCIDAVSALELPANEDLVLGEVLGIGRLPELRGILQRIALAIDEVLARIGGTRGEEDHGKGNHDDAQLAISHNTLLPFCFVTILCPERTNVKKNGDEMSHTCGIFSCVLSKGIQALA